MTPGEHPAAEYLDTPRRIEANIPPNGNPHPVGAFDLVVFPAQEVFLMSVSSAAASGVEREALVALRDRLAEEIDACDSGRDLAALSRQFVDVVTRLGNSEDAKGGTVLDELSKRRAANGNRR